MAKGYAEVAEAKPSAAGAGVKRYAGETEEAEAAPIVAVAGASVIAEEAGETAIAEAAGAAGTAGRAQAGCAVEAQESRSLGGAVQVARFRERPSWPRRAAGGLAG